MKMNNTVLVVLIVILAGIYIMFRLPTLIYDKVIQKLAESIKSFEGYYPDSRSYINNNPGNLKYVGQSGSTGQDDAGFAIFPTYEIGWQALIRQLERSFSGLFGYSSGMTLYEFFARYSPDANSRNYAEYVAQSFNVSADTKLQDLKA